MENLKALIQWARDGDVVIRGIQPAEIPGRGTGIVAVRTLKAGEILLVAPHAIVRCLNTVSKSIRRKLPADMPIHGLLAASIILESGLARPWKAILPSSADLEAGMPFLWPKDLQDLLPWNARNMLEAQRAKYQRQWAMVSKAFPNISQEEYEHAWLLVNSRSFLDCTPEADAYPWDDQLALIPVADLFNHGDEGARVQASEDGSYTITADREYSKGEEVLIVYGHHRNDFMLVEYGFIMDRNRHDGVHLDDAILPRLNKDQKLELEKRGWLGNFPLSLSAGQALRTQAALHLLFCSPDEYTRFVDSLAEGGGSGTMCQDKLDACMVDILERFLEVVVLKLERLERTEVGLDSQKALLYRHWGLMALAAEKRIKELRGQLNGDKDNGSE